MHNEPNEIKTIINDLVSQVSAKEDHFHHIMQRIDLNQSSHKKVNGLLRFVLPGILSIILMVTMVFPVFGNESTLVDVYQNFRIQQHVNAIKHIEVSHPKYPTQQELKQYIIHTVLEKEFQLTPLQIQQIVSRNIDPSEMIGLAIMSKLSRQDPDFLLEQRKKLNWIRVVRRHGISPGSLIQEMRRFVQTHKNQVLQNLFIRGIVEAYSPETGTLLIEGVPFKIFLLPDTSFNSPINVGMDIEIEAVFLPETQKVGALVIRSFDPVKAGFITFSALVIHRDRHIVKYRVSEQQEETLILAPHILRSPANFLIRPGKNIRFVAFNDSEKGLIAIRFMPEAELPVNIPVPPMTQKQSRKGLTD